MGECVNIDVGALIPISSRQFAGLRETCMSGYVPQFDWDVFISYAQVDDAVPPALADQVRYGWVSTLAQNLEYKLSQKLGAGQVKIWRDKRTRAVGDPIGQKLQHDLDRSAIMLIILSKAYIHPECYYQRELQIFADASHGRGGRTGVHRPPRRHGDRVFRRASRILWRSPFWTPKDARLPAALASRYQVSGLCRETGPLMACLIHHG